MNDEIDWGGERGVFWHNADQDRGGEEVHGEQRRNLDHLRLKDEAVYLLDVQPGMTVFEVGCGAGANLVFCGLLGATVTGMDLADTDVSIANRKFAHLGITGQASVGDCRKIDADDASFDAVLSSDFHEHIDAVTQADVLAECWRILKPAGVLVVKTPNLAYLRMSLAYKRAQALLRGRSPRGFVVPHTPGTVDPQHIGLVDRPTLARQLTSAGFDRQEWTYAPLRRFGDRHAVTVCSTEIPVVRDLFSEELIVRARKPIAVALFPD